MTRTPLNIMQVLRAPTGGLWRHVVDLIEELSARGHRLGLVCDANTTDAQTERGLAQIESKLDIGLFRMPIQRNPGPSDLGAIWRMRGLARKHQIHVMHGHGAKGGLLARGAALGNKRLLAAYTPHGGVLNFDPKTIKGRLFYLAEKAMLPSTDAFLFESDFARASFVRQIGDPGGRGQVVHNGLQPGEFDPVVVTGSYDFVFIGELRQIKGIDILLKAMASVNRADGTPTTLAIAGGGSSKAQLQAEAQELGLGTRVAFFGVQPAREMFAKGRLVVVPSLKESLPYVVLEAAAANKPLIATRVGGIAEIFGPTADALIPAGDVGALKAQLETFIADPGAFAVEAEVRRDFVAQGFSVATMCDQIESIYLKSA